jgi:hypothetical protein
MRLACRARKSRSGLGTGNAERFSLSYQFGQRLRAHFSRDMATVDFDRNLGKAQLASYLLVHETGRNKGKNLSLARGECLKTGLQI